MIGDGKFILIIVILLVVILGLLIKLLDAFCEREAIKQILGEEKFNWLLKQYTQIDNTTNNEQKLLQQKEDYYVHKIIYKQAIIKPYQNFKRFLFYAVKNYSIF